MTNNNKITRFQLAFLLLHSQVGVGAVTLPHEVFMKAKSDSWISVLLAGIFVQIIIFIYGMLMKRFPSHNFYEIIQIILGKWIGKIIIFLTMMYYICLAGVILAKFSIIISAWMMPLTPKWIIAALVMLTVVYMAIENLQTIARFFFIATFIFPIYTLFTIYALKDLNITFILPIGNAGMLPTLKGVISTVLAFHGVEFLLFIYPFIQSDLQGIVKTASYMNVFITVYYTFIVIANLLILSPEELKIVPEPVLYIVKSFSFKILERPDLLITSIWIVIVVTTFISIIFISSLGMSVMFNTNRMKRFVFIVTVLSFSLSLTLTGVYEVTTVINIFIPFMIFFIFIMPTIFLLLSIIMNKKECEMNG